MTKQWVLNMATNPWGLNKKRSVGPTSEWIREADPHNVASWRVEYLKRLKSLLEAKKIDLNAEAYLESLGQKLYVKITEVLHAEVESIAENDCTAYIERLVIDRTFDGYQTEIKTVYGQLQQQLDREITPAPDDRDRRFNVDFYIRKDQNRSIGLQIKPLTYSQVADIARWKERLEKTHEAFSKEYGGPVFTIFSTGNRSAKKIENDEVIAQIRETLADSQSN